MNKYMVFAGIGFELVGAVLVGLYLGEYLEKRYPSKGLISAGIIMIVLIGWFAHIFFLLKKKTKE